MAKRKSTRRSSTSRKPRTRAPQAAEPVKELNLAEEYHYVVEDLRNMAIIALVLIAGLVALSFFL
jgi:hypothetical protein